MRERPRHDTYATCACFAAPLALAPAGTLLVVGMRETMVEGMPETMPPSRPAVLPPKLLTRQVHSRIVVQDDVHLSPPPGGVKQRAHEGRIALDARHAQGQQPRPRSLQTGALLRRSQGTRHAEHQVRCRQKPAQHSQQPLPLERVIYSSKGARQQFLQRLARLKGVLSRSWCAQAVT